jgi:hypothetical protein
MTEKQRYWLEIGEAYETPPEHRTGDQRELTYYGLCFAYSLQSDRQEPYSSIANFRLACGYVDGWSDTCWPTYNYNLSDDPFRATMAFLFAAMSDEDRNKVVEGL